MEQLIYQKSYQEYKTELGSELSKVAEGFVKIGYLLRVAQDTDILKESGYSNVTDFAQKEFGLDKSQVSRFIAINERFSVGGYSDHLQEKYQGYGVAKLGIMLQIPEEITSELTPEYSKTEILAVKEEVDAEKSVTDIEVLLEGENELQKAMPSILHRVIHQLGKDEPELYKELHSFLDTDEVDIEEMQEILAPAGEKLYSVRIMGKGRVLLSMKTAEDNVTVTPVRAPEEKETYTWLQVYEAVSVIVLPSCPAEESYWIMYAEKFPEKEKVAPVQPKEKRKESKVTKSNPPKPKKEPVAAVVEETVKTEEQLPGQTGIEDFPEYMPDGYVKEMAEGTDNEEKTEEGAFGAFLTADAGEGPNCGEGECRGKQATDSTEESDESHGTTESSGCGADPYGVDREEIWMQCYGNHQALTQTFAIWDHTIPKELLRVAYRNAIDLAAGLERMLNAGAEESESAGEEEDA